MFLNAYSWILNLILTGLGDKDWQPYRFRQFYLDVSDLPASQKTTAHRTRCYTDNTTHPDVLPHIIDIPCKHTARYVIVETTYDAPEDDPVAGAMLEICEIEVSGMYFLGWSHFPILLNLVFICEIGFQSWYL